MTMQTLPDTTDDLQAETVDIRSSKIPNPMSYSDSRGAEDSLSFEPDPVLLTILQAKKNPSIGDFSALMPAPIPRLTATSLPSDVRFAKDPSLTKSISVLAPSTSVLNLNPPALCKGFLGINKHSWLFLQPSSEQLEEVRRLISFGRGTLGRIGARKEDVCDRVCRKCFKAENNMARYITALKMARGE